MDLIIMNIIIGLIVFIGFFIFYGRTAGWFSEGGLVYEWWKNKRTSKKKNKNSSNNKKK